MINDIIVYHRIEERMGIMTYFVKLFLASALIFLVIDLVWLILIAKQTYQNQIGGLLGPTKIVPAALFYVLYICGIIFFVLHPALDKGSLSYALIAGGFLGLLCYGTYDLTNLATLKNWSTVVTVIDLAWGAFVTATTSGLVYGLAKYFNW